MRLVLLAVVLVSTLTGCAHNRQYFRPTERVKGQTLQGYPLALYELVGSQGRFGEAKVWSVGAYKRGDTGVVEVTLDVHNTSAKPVEISARDLNLGPVRTRNGDLERLPAAETGVFKVQPESRASVRAHFLLPKGLSPGEVRGFGFNWRVRNVDQTYAQATPFREEIAYSPSPYYRGDLYYHSVYPCSPYDITCVGFYDDWPYARPVYVPVPYEREERRQVDVRQK